MKAKTILAVFLIALFALAIPATAQEAGKIGVIEVQRVLNASQAGKAATTELTKKATDAQQDLLRRNDEIEALKKTLERKMMVMNPERRDEKQRELRNKALDFKDMEKKYQDELRGLEKSLKDEIIDDVINLVTDIGKKEGYVLIVDRNEGGVIYAPDAIDLTDRVIREYNTQYQKDQAKKK